MHVGLLSLGDLLTDPVTGLRRTPAERHRSLVDQAVLAESVGFDAVHLGEHHFSDYILSAPQMVLAAIAERTTTMRLSNGVALAANLDPIRVAEDYATLDVLSNGRAEPCFGRGSLFPHVYKYLGQDEADSVARYRENVELIHRLWTEDSVTATGRFHAPLDDVTVHPRPVQSPRPPIWIGAGLSPDSIDLAARLGCRLMLPTVFGNWEMFVPIVDRYCELWEHYGHDIADRRIGCCSHFFVGRDSAATKARWAPRYMHYLQSVIEWQRDSARRVGQTSPGFPLQDFDTMNSTIAICGSPAEVIDRMGTARETLRLDTHLLMFDMGGTPDVELFESIELAGSEVLPAMNAMATTR
jgi:alkanesulfonate monooxygenase SsuD/methylene tetrahydromethanopterin reductase-like flavin-dependent oxidoreductase (luciferase family)